MTTVARTIVTSSHRVWDDTDATTKTRLADLSSDAIEGYLRYRLRQRAKWETKAGIVEKGVLKPPRLTKSCAGFGAS